MKVKELLEDLVVNDWLDILNPSGNTKKIYLQAMQTFTDWIGQTPEDLLIAAEGEIKAGKLMRQRQVKQHLTGFRKYLQEQKLSDLTIRSRMTGIKSFYKTFDIEIPTMQRTGRRARPLEENKAIPTKEDLQQVLKVCDPLEKAVLLIGVSSGLSSNEIRNLKIKEFKKGYDPETEITTLVLRREKVAVDFVTFISPEGSRAVWDYLAFRERKPKYSNPKRIAQLSKQKITNDDGYLFIIRNVPKEFIETQDEELRKLQESTVTKIYRVISEKAIKNTPTGQWNLIRSHNVRKYFNSAMLNAGADSFFVEFTMGHALNGTQSAYFRASPEKLRDIYKKFIPFLTIQKELDISESPEYQKIKYENQILATETARHIVERSELQNIRIELENLKALEKEKSEFLLDISNLIAEKPETLKAIIDKQKQLNEL
ncbi:tyrosine-type recombinase/integrase [Methanosarcina sp. 1.H.A.2.2]|uniref:tyrosine-type recombinase/integrase n=1 Tax=Methanosarcina sp. 1.H.A.2.2 TaxID=1483601 RepID=UPI000621D0AD|nr:tyrosine-type recombinase/integrase [Methanosarcina sp. 1.H.A.2.2]KKH47545.1 hypothetical protein EO93_01495 [Methanosarcina sp. 1.H.A.2.2]